MVPEPGVPLDIPGPAVPLEPGTPPAPRIFAPGVLAPELAVVPPDIVVPAVAPGRAIAPFGMAPGLGVVVPAPRIAPAVGAVAVRGIAPGPVGPALGAQAGPGALLAAAATHPGTELTLVGTTPGAGGVARCGAYVGGGAVAGAGCAPAVADGASAWPISHPPPNRPVNSPTYPAGAR